MRPNLSMRALLSLFLLLLLVAPAEARKRKLDPGTAASGLKEALSVGTGKAVDLLGQVDGYLKNADVRIEVPDKLRMVEKTMRALGQDEMVDQFVTSMNRAAEAAAPLAKEVFLDAIKEMSFEDAVQIVRGGDHAATDYLDERSRTRLKELFQPLVEEKLEEVGATAAFNRFVGRYAQIPFQEKPLFDLADYVTDRSLDGLFFMIAREEEKIRKNVVSRTSDLLREVFGSREAREGQKGERTPWWKRF
jgi:hypothetical protein